MSTRQSHPSANRMARQSPSRGFQRSAIALAVAALLSANVYAQEASQATDAQASDAAQDKKDEATELDAVVVTGVRGSVTKAQQIKQNAEQIVDSIVAEEIGKPSDAGVTDALQRITGVQRNVREGNGIAIRGLTLVRRVEGSGAVRAQSREQIC